MPNKPYAGLSEKETRNMLELIQQGVALDRLIGIGMHPLHRTKLRIHRETLLDDLDPVEVADYLYSKGIFTSEHKNKVVHQSPAKEQNRKLLDMLSRRGPGAYTAFRQYLRREMDWLSKALDKTVVHRSNLGDCSWRTAILSTPSASETETDTPQTPRGRPSASKNRHVTPRGQRHHSRRMDTYSSSSASETETDTPQTPSGRRSTSKNRPVTPRGQRHHSRRMDTYSSSSASETETDTPQTPRGRRSTSKNRPVTPRGQRHHSRRVDTLSSSSASENETDTPQTPRGRR